MQQSIPCESARELLDVVLRHDVILAVDTALCSGNIDCTPPNSTGDLPLSNLLKKLTKRK